jgi:hypothetical protein
MKLWIGSRPGLRGAGAGIAADRTEESRAELGGSVGDLIPLRAAFAVEGVEEREPVADFVRAGVTLAVDLERAAGERAVVEHDAVEDRELRRGHDRRVVRETEVRPPSTV